MMTQEDRQLLEQSILQGDQPHSPAELATLKLIYGLLEKAGLPESEKRRLQSFKALNPSRDQDREEASPKVAHLLHLAFQYADSADIPVYYTTGQLAKIFGVSLTTINNWLRDKRITYPDMEQKPTFKQSRIPDTAVYKAPNGSENSIREAAQSYNYQQKQRISYDEVSRMKELMSILLAFEEQYDGNYENVTERLGDPALSDDWRWKRDSDEWLYVMGEITRER